MKTSIRFLLFIFLLKLGGVESAYAQSDYSIFNKLDLNRKGLEKVKAKVDANDMQAASRELLKYYKKRTSVKLPFQETESLQTEGGKPSKGDFQKADDALKHVLFAHRGYKPYFYGDDINWQLWPIKDNELRWQLHRMYWWESMAKVYAFTDDNKYAKEWVYQYKDWVKKNPMGLSAENDRFAWRALEVSHRLENQPFLFQNFIESPDFDADFLITFLNNYYLHATHIGNNYSERGNHLLFEAQRLITAGAFFPEFKESNRWIESGVAVLNDEINKQVFADGLQYELSFNYHYAAINIFIRALNMLEANNIHNKFPESYKKTVESMVMAIVDFSFPDYTYPMFSDAKLQTKRQSLQSLNFYLKTFPKNPVLNYFASEGKKGKLPSHLSHAFKDAGIYTFRNGWSEESTMMIMKASVPAFWHSQPDNGTFELYINGTNFFPDAGAYVYGGDEEVMKERNWFRQTRVHNTLTLNNENINIDGKRLLWETGKDRDVLVYENPSYDNLNHRRSVHFIDKKFFVIIDEAKGNAQGNVAIHYAFKEGKTVQDKNAMRVLTDFGTETNVLLQVFPAQTSNMSMEEGFVSYGYREKLPRDAYSFSSAKNGDQTTRFITVIYPVTGNEKAPALQGEITKATDNELSATVKINGKTYTVGYKL